MHLAVSICNPAWHKCRTMVKNYLSRSCYNASSNLQLQTGAFLCAALPMRFAIDRLQTRKAGAPHQIDQIDQHLLSVNSADFSALLRLRTFHFFTFFFWNRALATVPCTFCQPDLQKCSAGISFLTFWNANRSLATVLCTFCQQLSQIEARNRGNRDPTSATPVATLYPEKTQGFAPWTVTLLYYWMMMLLTSWCGRHDGVNANHDHCLTLGSFLTKLPLINN